ncbi:hypothetical protein VQ02_17835 [Methylobacterium variabile]|uniref:Uncharacterized protein n=1 Tax=Methylobacterium variabile TaxID=298794 RepID=A0A0J6SIK3_9HYPH|nr:hypothetical protein VQ02_17835 [Methylobacterium variabile]
MCQKLGLMHIAGIHASLPGGEPGARGDILTNKQVSCCRLDDASHVGVADPSKIRLIGLEALHYSPAVVIGP